MWMESKFTSVPYSCSHIIDHLAIVFLSKCALKQRENMVLRLAEMLIERKLMMMMRAVRVDDLYFQ